jgi:aspartyl protease family protein
VRGAAAGTMEHALPPAERSVAGFVRNLTAWVHGCLRTQVRILMIAPALLLASFPALALDIDLVGVFPGKAVLVVDDATPRTYSPGGTIAEGIRLVSVDSTSATIDFHGKRQSIPLGGHINRHAPTGNAKVVLEADGQGHFITQGQINGGTIRMLVDTGATAIALPAQEAQRLGINYRRGEIGRSNTANGPVMVYRVKLDSVRIGDVEVKQVDATVQESGLPFALLGMSFLNRMDMRREGQQMTLTKRF